jgi:hypothetical protein
MANILFLNSCHTCMNWKSRCTILTHLLLYLCVCVVICLNTYKVFSPPYRSSFKFEFAFKNLVWIPWNVKSMLRSLYHRLTLIPELIINQLPSLLEWPIICKENTGIVIHIDSFANFKKDFFPDKKKIPFAFSNGSTWRRTSQTGLVSWWWRAWYASQPQPKEPR